MSDLRTAAQQALNALGCLEYSFCGITDGPSEDTTEAAITALRAALVEDAMQKFTDVNQELEAALAEPAPPPEAQTEAEKIAYCAGWWAAMEEKRS